MTYDGPNNGEGLHDTQLDVTELRTRGYSIISPGDALTAGSYSVSINTGNLNASDTLTVGTSGDEAVFDGSTVSLSSATDIGIGGVNTDGQGNEQYRFDIIWIDSNGEVNKTPGQADTLAPAEIDNDLARFERFSNPIPEPGTWPAPIVAVVVVNSGDSSVTASQLRDYRVPADIDVEQINTSDVSTNSLSGPLTGGSTLSDIAGSGLNIASNALDVAVGSGIQITSDAVALASDISVDSIANSDYNETVNSIADASGTTDIDFSVANIHEVEADGDITFTFSNITSSPAGNSLLLRVYDDDGTGSHTLSYPSSVEWDRGIVEDTVPSNGELLIAFATFDGGTTVKGMLAGEAFA